MDFSGFLSGIGDPEALLQGFGPWVLAGLGLIIFIESGVLFPFLPGDSLLVTAAVLRSELDVMSRDVVLAPARNDTVPIQEVPVQTACH